MTDITELVASEIADFCAGLGSPGESETPEQIQRELMERIIPLIKDERREWMARGVEMTGVHLREWFSHEVESRAESFADKIRSGEIE